MVPFFVPNLNQCLVFGWQNFLPPPNRLPAVFFVYRFWNAVPSPGQAKTKDQIVIFIINFYFFCVEVFFKNQ